MVAEPEPRSPEPSARVRRLTAADLMLPAPTVHPGDTTVATVRDFLAGEHVHCALLVDRTGLLIAMVERADLARATDPHQPAAGLAPIAAYPDRSVPLDATAEQVWARFTPDRRRVAVLDEHGRLAGLLCLKRRRTGFCTPADVAARAADPRR
ncbi:MAG TPA: CBS domain-containing protein [Jatrophihabitans sp.]|nr:CBS domain-containing protein [Jatrophihabitans sp.]